MAAATGVDPAENSDSSYNIVDFIVSDNPLKFELSIILPGKL